jgi:hypothetical protein
MLEEHDDPTAAEHPALFDRRALQEAVGQVRLALEGALGRDLPLDDQAQDASFYADLELQRRTLPGRQGVWISVVRFSNFGRMVAFSSEEDVPPDEHHKIERLLMEHGFTLIPGELLDRDYDGRHPAKEAIRTWWDRYFDYL